MWELDHKESWVLKNWCFQTVVLESPLDSREIKPVNPKGNQPWKFIWRMMLKLKLQYFGHLMRRPDSLEKTLMLGKTEGKRRRGQHDEMVGWHHWLSGHEFEQALGDGDGQGSLAAAIHGVAKSQTWLSDWTEMNIVYIRVHSVLYMSMYCTRLFDKFKMSCIHYHSIIENGFTTLKSSMLWLVISPSFLTPCNYWSLYCLHSFVFYRNYIIGITQYVAFSKWHLPLSVCI